MMNETSKLGGKCGADGPTDDLAAENVDHPGVIKPAFVGGNISDIRHPNLIDAGSRSAVFEEVRRDGPIMSAVGGLRTTSSPAAAADPLFSHEAGDATPANRHARRAQVLANARTAISLPAAHVELEDARAKARVLLRSPARLMLAPSVEAAARDAQRQAELSDWIGEPHRRDPLEAFVPGSERMPSVFLKS